MNQTIYRLDRKKWDRQKTLTLDVAFRRRFMDMSTDQLDISSCMRDSVYRKQTITALERRRKVFLGSNHNSSNNVYNNGTMKAIE